MAAGIAANPNIHFHPPDPLGSVVENAPAMQPELNIFEDACYADQLKFKPAKNCPNVMARTFELTRNPLM